MSLTSINPTTGETIETFEELDDAAIDAALASAARAFRERRAGSVDDRSRCLAAAARLLEEEKVKLARIAVTEMGKPLRAAIAEVEKCALTCRHYADHATVYLADEPLASEATESYVRHLPLGPVLAIMPWNFPYWQLFRFAAPALLAGNVALLKHASNVSRCALAIEDVIRRAGFAEGMFRTLLVGSRRVGRIIADERVAAVTLTGSEGAGVAVATAAGQALKKTVLELGGSDPFVVMPSADVDAAVRVAVTARTINNGQSCIAAKRFIVHRDVYRAFEERFVAAIERLRVGDPLHENTDLGPLATADVRDNLEKQVQQSVAAGARLLAGGRRIDGRGFFFPATVLADVPEGAPAATEELFGPVAPLFVAEDVAHAIALANATPYGLGSSVWTNDRGEERRFVDEIVAGQTFVNAMVASDPRLPFGGVKRSGYGRELSVVGMREFMNAKTVYVNRSQRHHVSSSE
ncbi:MAG: aldehyde dehydrogenase [Myxococcales bacterium]|nr:aldehyde dehydrogenase [Myxococcales bacterium]